MTEKIGKSSLAETMSFKKSLFPNKAIKHSKAYNLLEQSNIQYLILV